MKNRNGTIALLSNLREHYHGFLERELAEQGFKGILFPHGSILTVLFRNGGAMQVLEIAEHLDRSKSSISELVDRLAALGYVTKERSETDRRATRVCLTPAGWSLKEPFSEISRRLIATAFEGFSDAEAEMLVDLLLRMKGNFQRKAE